MRAINHALTGTLIGFTVNEPVVAVPVAFLSHFVLDIIPHYGTKLDNPAALRTKNFIRSLYADAILCGVLIAVLFIIQPINWQLAAICAFAAVSPDLLSINRFIKAVQKKPWRASAFSKFAKGIQWFQRPVGAIVEIIWLVATIILIAPFVLH